MGYGTETFWDATFQVLRQFIVHMDFEDFWSRQCSECHQYGANQTYMPYLSTLKFQSIVYMFIRT